jgi:D-xylose transport system substrate-binding protein
VPPVTGQDAEIAGIQRIIAGEQYMTVYKPIKPEADATAELAVDLLAGTSPARQLITGSVNNGTLDVPSVILNPVAVTKNNVKTTIIADKFHTAAEICVGQYTAACTALGIQ